MFKKASWWQPKAIGSHVFSDQNTLEAVAHQEMKIILFINYFHLPNLYDFFLQKNFEKHW